MIARIVGFHGNIAWDTTQPNGQPRRCLDVSRAEREFGFRASTPLDKGLRTTLHWYLARQAVLKVPDQGMLRGTATQND